MAKKNTYKKKKSTSSKSKGLGSRPFDFDWSKIKELEWKADFSFLHDRRLRLSLGLALLTLAAILFLSFLSALIHVRADQSVLQALGEGGDFVESGTQVKNWLGLLGASLAHLVIYEWFGLAAFFLPPFSWALGWKLLTGREIISMTRAVQLTFFGLFWVSLLLGYFLLMDNTGQSQLNFYAGGIGYKMAILFNSFIGWGTPLILILTLSIFLVYFLQLDYLFSMGIEEETKAAKSSLRKVSDAVDSLKEQISTQGSEEEQEDDPEKEEETKPALAKEPKSSEEMVVASNDKLPALHEGDLEMSIEDKTQDEVEETGLSLQVAESIEEVAVEDFDQYDPTLDLSHFQRPNLDLLEEIDNEDVKVTQEELQENKNRIVKTLNDFKIGISSIKATIGPTVTLYEIVPKAGVKISKIRNLEDDIALSLAALGIRIIAPIPGKGTIGIEVPNKSRQVVSVRSVLGTDKFIHTDKELPVALGRTISNEVFITDLTKMPHLLMAGATGQGKSVGLNIILTSLLYKKHPAELKFVLIDPKKVELALFNKIERHYLATLPDAEEAIITDTSRVVNTLNSLCVEMDVRYNLLKDAGCRNIKEYNKKFKNRRLNPENGHRFLPYIVLVIDELADLMMVAGKEVELPIARLAQLARAIGIHLIIATQRPSVNVITGVIKANFPARLSYKVSSKIDSRTILDTGGADQLIGMGDMLLSNGSDIIRLQCAYIDTEEVERVCEYIGEQRGYDTAYLLPEFEDEGKSSKQIDLDKLDAMFAEAARVIVMNQQGSTSLIQRKLSLGYNRAGRIIDQLEAAGIVGPFEGSKARQVLVTDEYALEQVLRDIIN